MHRRRLLQIAAATAIGLFAPAAANAAEYPSQAIRIVVPWAAGGGTDAIARALATAMEPVAGQSVIVDNISGASGATGSLNVAQATPDGYTALLNGSSDLTALLTFQDLPFSLDDFEYVGGVFDTPTWMVAHRDRGYETFDEFVEAAKQNPGQLTIGVGGAVGAHALMAHAIKGYLDLDVRVIAYQGGAALNKALLANEVHAGVIHSPVLLNEVREGLINVLVAGAPLTRITYEPVRDTKTLRDYDIPIEVGVTRGLMLPKGTPEDVVKRLSEITKAAAESESFAEFGANFGYAPVWLGPEEFENVVRTELETFRDIHARFIQN